MTTNLLSDGERPGQESAGAALHVASLGSAWGIPVVVDDARLSPAGLELIRGSLQLR